MMKVQKRLENFSIKVLGFTSSHMSQVIVYALLCISHVHSLCQIHSYCAQSNQGICTAIQESETHNKWLCHSELLSCGLSNKRTSVSWWLAQVLYIDKTITWTWQKTKDLKYTSMGSGVYTELVTVINLQGIVRKFKHLGTLPCAW